MAEFNPQDCTDDTISCSSTWTAEQLFMYLFTTDANGCLALRVSGASGGGGGGGDASAANQVTGNGLLSTINGKDFATQATLEAVLDKLNASIAVTGTFWQATQPVTLPSGVHVLTSSAVTSSSSITAGAKSISIIASADFSGTINGAGWPAGGSKNITSELGKTLPAIAYTVTAGTLYIDILT